VTAYGREPPDQVVEVLLRPCAGAQTQLLSVPGPLQHQRVGETDGPEAHHRGRDEPGCGEAREAQRQNQGGQRHRRHHDARGEQPIGPCQNLADDPGEVARLVPGTGRRIEDRLQDSLADRIGRPVLGLEAQARDAPAEDGQDHRADGDAQEGREFELRRAHRKAGCQHEFAARQCHGEAQERQRRRLVARQHGDQVAQAQQGEGAERRADPDREGNRSDVQTPRSAPGQDEGIGFHASPGGISRGGWPRA
jgi:hypothetical protein